MDVGVVGTGSMGAIHARLLSGAVAGARLVAASDPHARLPDVPWHEDAEALIADPAVEGVVIASPAAAHEAQVLACLAAGKRVLCEKPLTTTAAAARRLVEADRDGRLTVGFMRRFDPAYAELKARVDAGEVGAPRLVHMVHRNASFKPGFTAESVLTDSLVHEADVARWLLGEEIARVTAFAVGDGLNDPQAVIFETASGRIVDVECFVAARYGYEIRCEVVGEAGTLELAPPALVVSRRAGARAVAAPEAFEHRFGEAYRLELQAWVDGVRGPSAADGHAATAVCEAAVASRQVGGTVQVVL
jgi:myo-inositol 2-dehydrogenase / D-chiro-inositol 1-dehydrogenase